VDPRLLGILFPGVAGLPVPETSLADGRNRSFRLLSLPLYMVGQVRRLCREALGY
jgi:hypothetical protein